jgi:hypothetical protein
MGPVWELVKVSAARRRLPEPMMIRVAVVKKISFPSRDQTGIPSQAGPDVSF